MKTGRKLQVTLKTPGATGRCCPKPRSSLGAAYCLEVQQRALLVAVFSHHREVPGSSSSLSDKSKYMETRPDLCTGGGLLWLCLLSEGGIFSARFPPPIFLGSEMTTVYSTSGKLSPLPWGLWGQVTLRLTRGWSACQVIFPSAGFLTQPSQTARNLVVSQMPLPCRSDTWPARAGTAERVVCKGLNRWRLEFQSPPTRESASLGLRFQTYAVGMATSPCAMNQGGSDPADPLPAPAAVAPRPCPTGPGGRRRILTAQVIFPHSVCLPECPAITAAASSTAACYRSPAPLHHLPAPAARCSGRHDFGSATSRLSSRRCLRVVPRLLLPPPQGIVGLVVRSRGWAPGLGSDGPGQAPLRRPPPSLAPAAFPWPRTPWSWHCYFFFSWQCA